MRTLNIHVATEGRQGFTLIEVLVVVAIIARLIAILLPSLPDARNQAKAMMCATKMWGMNIAAETYKSKKASKCEIYLCPSDTVTACKMLHLASQLSRTALTWRTEVV